MSVLKYLCFVAHCHPAHPRNVGMSSWLITGAIMEGRKEGRKCFYLTMHSGRDVALW